jgi:hypothetical protein
MYRTHFTTSEDESGIFGRVETLARSSTLCKNRVLSMYRTTVHIVLREGDACRLVSMICVRTWFYQILLLVYSLVYERAMPVGSLR